MDTALSCSASSLAAGEQLHATASRADAWLLLEHPETYGHSALSESSLPADIQEKLDSAAASIPNSKVLLIKRGREISPDGRRFFAAVNHEEQPNLYEFRLERVEDLLDLDLAAVLREDPAYRTHDRTEPLFLVCTNGRRDPCCSSLGLPLYREMRRAHGDAVWQTSHVGGHRFAPNIVALPSGSYYGYAQAESSKAIVTAERGGYIHLPNFRGRSCYAPVVQAADAMLRRETGRADLLAFRLGEIHEDGENAWTCRFEERGADRHFCVSVHAEPGAVRVQKSCRDDGPVPIRQFRLGGIETFHFE